MKKKYITLIVLSIIVAIIIAIPTSARVMTLEELGTKIFNDYDEDYNAYLIGEHAFTTSHGLSSQDIMVGARSITPSTPELDVKALAKEMTIYEIMKKGNTWEYKTIMGNQTLNPQSININYINYNFVAEESNLEISLGTTDAVDNNYGYQVGPEGLTLENNEISGIVKQDANVTSHSLGDTNTKYYIPLKLKIKNGSASTTIKVNEQKVKETGAGEVTILVPVTEQGKETASIKVQVDLDGEGTKFDPVTETLTYKTLQFEKDTTITFNTNISQRKEELDGFDPTIQTGVSVSSYVLNGQIKAQRIGDSKKFYVAFNANIPNKTNDGKVEAIAPSDTKTKIIKTIKNENSITVTFLVELTKDNYNEEQVIKINVDADGNGSLYKENTYEIKLNNKNLKFIDLHTVTYQYGSTTSEDVYHGEQLKTVPEVTATDYHTFNGWYNEGSLFDTTTKTVEKDMTLIPHYALDADTYIEKVISELNTENKYTLEKNDTSIAATVNEENDITLSTLTDKLAEKIAEVLSKGEVTEVALTIGDNAVTLTSENHKTTESIKTAIESYTTETMDRMALNGKTVKLKISKLKDTITLKDTNTTEYTISFAAAFANVKNEAELKTAIQKASISTIKIADNISASSSMNISRNVTLKNNAEYKITADNDNLESIFNISSNAQVTMNSIKLNGNSKAETAVKVSNTSELNVTSLSMEGVTKAGVEVADSGKFISDNNLKMENETYDIPAVITLKSNNTASVKISDGKNGTIPSTIKEEVKTYEALSKPQPQNNRMGDVKTEVGDYKNYYLNETFRNRWYMITYVGDRAVTGYPLSFVRYYDRTNSEVIPTPPTDIENLTKYDKGTLATYKIKYWVNANQTKKYDATTMKESSSQTLINLTGDTALYAELEAEYQEGVLAIGDDEQDNNAMKEALKNAVKQDASASEKIIIIEKEIDLGEEELDIQRNDILITGALKGNDNIHGVIKGKIKVSGSNVKLSKIKIVGNTSTKDYIIDVVGTGFKYSEIDIESTGETIYDTAIKMENFGDDNTLYFGVFKNLKAKTFITLNKVTGTKGAIVGSDFYGTTETENFVEITAVENNAKMEFNQTTLGSYTFDADKHVKQNLLKIKGSENTANINIGGIYNFMYNAEIESMDILIDVTENPDVSNYTIDVTDSYLSKLKVAYTKDNGKDYTYEHEVTFQ